MREDFAKKRAINFAIRLDGKCIGEVLLYRFDGKGGAAHGDTNVTINLYATVREEADIEKISRQIAKEIKRQECFA